MTLNKFSKLVLALGVTAALAACGNTAEEPAESSSEAATSETTESSTEAAVAEGPIYPVSREEGSGTRDAFTEITGVLVDDTDNTTQSADIQNSTDAVMTTVASDQASIGYISLGSLSEDVKALEIDGVAPTEETVADESYPIARPFNIVYSGELEGAAADFHDFIFSAEGQQIVVDEGYVTVDPDAAAYEGDGSTEGEINVVGSTSVSPVMEVLAEEYMALNPGVTISTTANGSSAGVQAAVDGTADIGMASRALEEEEASQVTGEAIAMDGIAVIINNDNALTGMSLEDVRTIFTGDVENWEDIASAE